MIKLCVFDLDGTLTDTMPSISYYVNRAIEPLSGGKIEVKYLKHYVGDGAGTLIKKSLRHFDLPDKGELFEKTLASYVEDYDKAPLYLTEPYDGIKDAIAELKSKGYKLAVFSNKPDSAAKQVVKHFFGDVFDIVRGACENVALKPSPDGLCAIIKELGFLKEEAVMIGDTKVDIATGANAGVETIGVLWGFRDKQELETAGANHIIEHPSQILNCL